MTPTRTPHPVHDETVRMAPLAARVQPTAAVTDSKTVRMRAVEALMKPLPAAVSAFDGKTVRMRPVIDAVGNTVRQRYLDLGTQPTAPTAWGIARVLFVIALASMPIVAIPLDVFGIVPQYVSSIVIVVMLAVLGALIAFAPHRTDMAVGRGLIGGMVACVVYDAARLAAVHILHLMGDFIIVMGSFVTGEPDTHGSAIVGYVWRYVGDGGGLGVAFFVVAFALGIDRWKPVYAVLAFVAMAVFPTWTGLIATVAIAPRGEQMMFDLNPATFIITLVGHLIFGAVLGLAFLAARRGAGRREWPWPPILEAKAVRRFIPPALRATHRTH